MAWYWVGLLVGAAAPLTLWSIGLREAFRGGALSGLARYADTCVVSVPIALAGAFLVHLVGGSA